MVLILTYVKSFDSLLSSWTLLFSILFTRLAAGHGDCPRGTLERSQVEHVDIRVLVHSGAHFDRHAALSHSQLPLPSNQFVIFFLFILLASNRL